MGTSIEINLSEVLNNPKIGVSLSCDVICEDEDGEHHSQTAEVAFNSSAGTSTVTDGPVGPRTYIFDVYNRAGIIILVQDYNLFRNPKTHLELTMHLMNASISYRVIS